MLVVDDGPDDATRAPSPSATARATSRTTAPRGLNAARNTGIDATDRRPARASSTTTSRCRPGWLAALLARRRAAAPRRRRLHRPDPRPLRGPPLSDVRPRGAADHVPRPRRRPTATRARAGARTWPCAAARSSASGASTSAARLYGDEEEWQARWRAAGGRIRYVAAAALDHRRAGDDARLRSLARAAYRRGQASRRFDAFKGTAPSLARELRVLAGCARPRPAPALLQRRRADRPLASGACASALAAPAAAAPRRRPTTSCPARAGRSAGARGTLLRAARRAARRSRGRSARGAAARARGRARARRAGACSCSASSAPAGSWTPRAPSCGASRHEVAIAHGGAGRARQVREPQRAARRARPAERLDWLLVVDDDVVLPRGFLDRFLHVAERAGLRLAQPAHRLHSHAAWPVTRRRAGARRARDALRRDRAGHGVPRATRSRRCCRSRTCAWAGAWTPTGRAVAREHGWPIGDRRRDADPPHARRSAARYAREAAIAEARAFLAGRPYVRARRGPHAGGAPVSVPMKVAVVAEFYPRAADPVLGVWAHRQALAARDAGADVRVLVLHRPMPPLRDRAAATPPRATAARALAPAAARDARRHRGRLRALPRAAAAARLRRWGAGRRRRSRSRLRRLRRASRSTSSTPTTPCPPARPCAARGMRRAARRLRPRRRRLPHRRRAIAAGAARGARARSARARLVLANSAGIERACRALGARAHARRAPRHRPAAEPAPRRPARADARRPSATSSPASATPTSLRALWLLRDRHPTLRYLVIGDGPERDGARAARRRARRRRPRRVRRPARPHDEALERARDARAVRDADRPTRRSASPTSRRWPAGCPAIGAPRRARARGDRARRRRHALVPPGDVEALAERDRRAARRPATAARARRRGARDRRARVHVGALRARDGRRLRGRAAMSAPARPVRHQPRAARPRRRVRGAARARRRSSSRCSAGARTTPPAASSDPGVPHRHVDQREVHALAASGRYRAVVAARPAASRCPPRGSARAAPACRSCCGARCGRTRARPRTSPAAPLHARPVPRRRRGRRLRPARRRLRARAAARATCTIAPQAVDNAFWCGAGRRPAPPAPFSVAVRRPRRAGQRARAVLLDAWRASGLRAARRARPRRRGSRSRRLAARRGPSPGRAAREVRNFSPARTFGHTVDPRRATSASRGGSSPTRP